MKNKLRISIGIPAFNEEKNISKLLESILKQKTKPNSITELIIANDGSKDNTLTEIKKHKSKKIKIINGKIRKGKPYRLNQIFSKFTGDILVLLDADIYIHDTNFINKIVSPFTKKTSVGLVSANNLPIRPRALYGRIWYTAEMMWYEMRKNTDDSTHLYNNSGCSIALIKKFAKQIHMPVEAIADQQFMYMLCKSKGFEFFFNKDATIYYLPPQTFNDILIQYQRSEGEDEQFIKYFGTDAKKFLVIPFKMKLTGFLYSFINNPFYTVISVVFLKYLFYITKNIKAKSSVLWKTTKSTKNTYSYYE